MTKDEKALYFASPEWARRREAVRTRCNNICERCWHDKMYACHHLRYDTLKEEPLEHLQGVCNPCHEFLSGKTMIDPILEHLHIRAKPYGEGCIIDSDCRGAGRCGMLREHGKPCMGFSAGSACGWYSGHFEENGLTYVRCAYWREYPTIGIYGCHEEERPWREERLNEVLSWLSSHGHHEMCVKINNLNDDKGELTVSWEVPPTDAEKKIMVEAWGHQNEYDVKHMAYPDT